MRRLRRYAIEIVYSLGVGCAAAFGFTSPAPFTGFAPLAAGLIFAALGGLVDDGEEAPSGNLRRPPRP